MRHSDHLVERIRSLLNAQELLAAQREASRAAEDHPDHPWLQQANRILNPSRVTTAPASGSDRTREFAWLRRHSEAYRGQWVALAGDELIVADRDFDVVLRQVRAKKLNANPLVHRVD